MDKQFNVKLVIKRAPALAALTWLKQSWQIFAQVPHIWLLMYLHLFGILLLLVLLPPVVSYVAMLAIPFFTAGIYRSVVAVQQKKPVSLSELYQPFKESRYRQVFISLAVAELLVSIPMMYLSATIQEQVKAGTPDVTTLILFAICFCLTKMLFAYSVAIAYFLQERRLLVILQASLIACWRNVTPLVLFSLLSLVLIMLTIPTYFIGLLVVLPLLHIAFFLSFNEFFALQIKPNDEAVLEV